MNKKLNLVSDHLPLSFTSRGIFPVEVNIRVLYWIYTILVCGEIRCYRTKYSQRMILILKMLFYIYIISFKYKILWAVLVL